MTDPDGRYLLKHFAGRFLAEEVLGAADCVRDAAEAADIPMACMAIAWVLHNGHGVRLNDIVLHPRSRPTAPTVAVTCLAMRATWESDLLARLPVRQVPADSVAVEYIDICTGSTDGGVFTWQSPWDHAAGMTAVACLGGRGTGRTGTPFTPDRRNQLPLVVAHDPTMHARLLQLLP